MKKVGQHLVHKQNLSDIKKWVREWRYKLFKHIEEKAKELVTQMRTDDDDIQQCTETNVNHVASFYSESENVRCQIQLLQCTTTTSITFSKIDRLLHSSCPSIKKHFLSLYT